MRWIQLFILSFVAGQLNAQQLAPDHFARYTTADGLSHSLVSGLAQDSAGYIWVATESGLNRFNGSHFVQFHSTRDSQSLAAEGIYGLTWLDGHRLAAITTGLHIVDTRTGKTRNLFIPYHRQQYQYKFNMLMRAVGDEKGHTYVLSRSGFYHFDAAYRLLFRFDYYSEKDVLSEHFFFGEQLVELDNRRLLIVSRERLYVYDKLKKNLKKMEAADCPAMAAFLERPAYFYAFFQQKAGSLFVIGSGDSVTYINTVQNKKTLSLLPKGFVKKEIGWRSRLFAINDTVFYITGHNAGFFKLRFYPASGMLVCDPEKNFSTFLCSSLLKDKDGHLWVGTDKGLFRQDPGRAQVQVAGVPAGVSSSSPNIVMSEAFAAGDKVYVGTRRSGHLLVYNRRNLQFIRNLNFDLFRKQTGQPLNIFAIAEADSATLVLATEGPPFLVNKAGTRATPLHPPNWGPEDWAADVYKDSKNGIWISSYHVYLYNPARHTFTYIPENIQLSSQIIQPEAICEDAAGNIWMAGHGLSRYNTVRHCFDLRLDSFPFIKMPDKQVNAIAVDKARHTIWFNSSNNGLMAYDIVQGGFQHFTTSDGLPDNNIAALVLAGNQLWVAGASSGIASINLDDFTITGFGKEDGFPDMPVAQHAGFFYDSASHELYLPFAQALARFRPNQLLGKKAPPQTFIEEVVTGAGKPVFLPAHTITTSWKDNDIKITIGSINFSDPGCQRFAYRIVKDTATVWTDMGNQPSFSISSLLPGTHRIQVKVYSLTHRWPEQVTELAVVVAPPLWLTDWFLMASALAMLVLLYGFIKWRTGLARKKEREKTYVEKLKADHYKNQFELEQISNYFSSSLAGKKTEDAVLWDVAANLIGRMNYEDCIIYTWNEAKTRMVQKAAYGPKGKPEVISADAFEVAPGQGIVGHVIQTMQPVLVPDTRADSRYRVDDEFRLSEVAVPIIHNTKLLGVIDSEHSLPGYFSERDIKILTTIATLIGNKLKQLESEQSLEAKQRELAGTSEQLAEARLSALQAQMNPHFVFNALNSIKRMILDGNNEKASRYLSKFALMIRMTLEHSKEPFVTLDENIEYLQAYLDMEQLRFDDSFSYSIHADANVDVTETVLPAMMIQPLVENAIWHGLLQVESAKKLTVTFSQTQNKIICSIEDNGIGIRKAEKLKGRQRPLHRSAGLENLQKRIKIINEKYNTACSLEIVDLGDTATNGRGTRAVLQLNLITI